MEEAMGYDLEAEAMDAEDKVAEANVVAVAVDEEDIMEMKGNTLTLIFTAYQTILTLKILHLMTTNGTINSRKNSKTQ